ncbi:MAG TPA: hypothetical protein VF792_10320 [Ktedonobacterales bacterium]
MNALTGAGQHVTASVGWVNILQVVLFLDAITSVSIPAVIGLGLVAAWADKHTGWLVTLTVVTLASIAWRPLALILTISTSPDPYTSPTLWLYRSLAISLFVTQLVPVVLALIFALRELRRPR